MLSDGSDSRNKLMSDSKGLLGVCPDGRPLPFPAAAWRPLVHLVQFGTQCCSRGRRLRTDTVCPPGEQDRVAIGQAHTLGTQPFAIA